MSMFATLQLDPTRCGRARVGSEDARGRLWARRWAPCVQMHRWDEPTSPASAGWAHTNQKGPSRATPSRIDSSRCCCCRFAREEGVCRLPSSGLAGPQHEANPIQKGPFAQPVQRHAPRPDSMGTRRPPPAAACARDRPVNSGHMGRRLGEIERDAKGPQPKKGLRPRAPLSSQSGSSSLPLARSIAPTRLAPPHTAHANPKAAPAPAPRRTSAVGGEGRCVCVWGALPSTWAGA